MIGTGTSSTNPTNGYQIYIDALQCGTNRWGLYVKRPNTSGASVATVAYFDAASTGGVGIGATNPQASLHMITNGFTAQFRQEGNTSDAVSHTFYQNNVLKYQIVLYGASQDFAINNGTIDAALWDSAGVLKIGTSATGATTALLATANCPATTGTSPYVWFKLKAPDGSLVYVPGWK